MQTTTIWATLQRLIPRDEVEEIAAENGGDRYKKKFGTWAHLWMMVYAQLGNRASLEHIVTGFFTEAARREGAGLETLSDSRLSEANRDRPSAIFAEVFSDLLDRYQAYLAAATGTARRRWRNVRIVDSTVVTAAQGLFAWAKFKGDEAAVKIHTLYDLFLAAPREIRITEGRVHDANDSVRFPPQKGVLYVFDRGYFDFEYFRAIIQAGAHFVTRLKKVAKFRWRERLPVSSFHRRHGVLDDGIIALGRGRKRMSETIRMVVYRDEEGRLYHFLTDRLDLSPLSVALLYRYRWEIETFFKWAKQHLKIKHLYGTSPNAVAVQVWTALIAYLLMQITKRLAEFQGRLLVWTRRLVDALVAPAADLFGGVFASNLRVFQRLKVPLHQASFPG